MSFRKIWIFYGLSVLWMLWGIAATTLGNSINHTDYSNYTIGGYIGEFIAATGPLWIVFAYDRIKTHREKKLKHAI